MTGVCLQVGFWDGSVAVVRLQPSTGSTASGTTASEGQAASPAGISSHRELQHDMVVLTHFQVDPTPLRAVAWCPPQVNPPPSGPLLLLLLLLPCITIARACTATLEGNATNTK